MDTESFLLERQAIIRRLQERRAASLRARSSSPHGLFGMSWLEWAQMFLGDGSGQQAFRWISRLALSTSVPFLIAYVKRKGASYLHNRKSPLGRLANWFSFFTTIG